MSGEGEKAPGPITQLITMERFPNREGKEGALLDLRHKNSAVDKVFFLKLEALCLI